MLLPIKPLAMSSCYQKHKRLKKRAYEKRARETEDASFIPLLYTAILPAMGGMAKEATKFY